MNQAEWNKRMTQVEADLSSGRLTEEEAEEARAALYEDLKKFKKRKSSIDLLKIATRVAAYDFRTKMKINALAIEEIGRTANVPDLNAVAEHIADSPVHGAVQALADAIHDEAAKIGKDLGLKAG